MALEVHESGYLFPSNTPRFDAQGQVMDPPPLPPFRYNYLHDLESAWWIGLWTTYVFAPNTPSAQDVTHFEELFPPPHTQRMRTSGRSYFLISDPLASELCPQQNELVFAFMNNWRRKLYESYFKLESNRAYESMLDEGAFQDVHDKVLRELNALLDALEKDGLGRTKLVHMPFSGSKDSKKPRII
jgi:hypothetical protein